MTIHLELLKAEVERQLRRDWRARPRYAAPKRALRRWPAERSATGGAASTLGIAGAGRWRWRAETTGGRTNKVLGRWSRGDEARHV